MAEITPIDAVSNEEFAITPIDAISDTERGFSSTAITPIEAISDADYAGRRASPGQGAGGYDGGTFKRSIDRGTKQSAGLAGQLLKSIGDSTGFAGAVELGDELIREAMVEAVANPARIHGFEDVDSISDLGELIKQTLGEQVFNIALAATGGGAGGSLGAFFAKKAVSKAVLTNLAKKSAAGKGSEFLAEGVAKRFFTTTAGKKALTAASTTGAKVGAAGGAFTAFYPINTGEILQEQRDAYDAGETDILPDLSGSLALGAVSSALEVLGFGLVGKALFGQAKKEVVDQTLRTVLGRVGHTSLKGLASEGGTEAVQEALVIASRKMNDPTFSITDAIASSEGLSRIAFAGVSGAIVGGVLAGGGGAAVGTAQAAQLGMQKAKARADIRPAIDALQELGKKDEGEETNSIFGGITLARRNTYKATVGRVRSAVKEWRRARKNGGDVDAAAAAVEETVNKAFDDMSVEVDALNKVKDILAEVESATLDGFSTLRNILNSMPTANAERRPSAQQAEKVAKAVAEAKEVRDSLPKNADLSMQVQNAQRTMELVSKITLNSLRDPLGVPVARLNKMLNQAEKVARKAIKERRAELDKSQRTLEVSARVIEREAGSKKKLPADPTTTEMATPTEETLASLTEVGKNRKRATFIRGYGADPAALPQAVTTKMGRLGLKPRPDVDGNRIVVVRKRDLDTPIEELEREEFPTPLAEVGEDAVAVTTRNKDGVPTKNELVPNDPAAIEEALARGTTSGTTTEARPASAAVTESVRMSNDEADSLALGLTIGQVEELADEQSVIYVRMPRSKRLMPAVVSVDETLQREDGKEFRLFATEAEAEAAQELKTSKQRLEDIPADNIEVVKIGDGFVIRVTLPGNRTAHKDRQVRKILRRGDSTPDKAKYTILGSKDGKEVRLHLGEVTKLGLLEEGGRGGDQLDARASFLTGLYTLAADYGYTVNFNPATQNNKVIYGNTVYKNAGPRRGTPFARKDFVDWLIDLVEQGEIEYDNLDDNLRLNLSKHIWDSGMYSPEEIAAIAQKLHTEKDITPEAILEGLALVQSKIVETESGEQVRETQAERQLAEPGENTFEGTTPVVQEKETPFNMRLHGESKTYNAVPSHQVRDLLSWPAAKQSVEFVLKYLNIKERVILFDEETASSLSAAYQVQGTAAAKHYAAEIENAVAADTSGRIIKPPKDVNKTERVVHIYVSKNRPTPQGVGRGLILMHEIGHLTQYTHLDRLPAKLRQQVLDSFGHENTGKNREVFANWMAKVATDMNRQQRHRRPARIDSVDDFFKTVVYDLRVIFQKLRRKLKYNKTFGSFVEALHTHAAAQRGEKIDTLWMTPLGRQMFDELEAAGNSGYITTPRPGIAEKAPAKKPPSIKKVPQKLDIWHGSGQNAELSNLASRPFTYQGKQYVSVEHAYQTWKSGKFDEETYNKRWRAGMKIPGRKGTDHKTSKKLMLNLIVASFEQNSKAQQALLATGDAELTHTRDRTIWRKEFPRILMGYRASLQTPAAPTGSVTVGYRAGVPAVNAAERKGEGISVLRKPGEKHFGNPFSHLPNARDARKTKNLQDSVDQYVAWLEGTAHQDYKQARRAWVLQQIDSGALDGKTLLYYSKQTPNHAEALKKFIDARRDEAGLAEAEQRSEEVVNGIDERTPEPVDPVIAKHDALRAEIEALDKEQQTWWSTLSAEEKRIYHEYNDDLERGPETQERKLNVLASAIQYVKGYKDVTQGQSRSDSKLAQADAVKLLPKMEAPVKRRNKLEKLREELTTLKYDNQEALARHPNALQHFVEQFPSEKAQGKKKGRWDILADLLVEWKANKDNSQWVSQQIARRKAYIKKQEAKFTSNVPAPVQSLLTLIEEEISLLESNDLQKALVTLDKLLTKQSGVERKYDYDRYPVPDLSTQDTQPTYDDMSLEVDAAVEQAEDSMFQNFVDNFRQWAATLKDDPIKAGKMLVYTADSELRGMGPIGVWLARQFRALPVSGEKSMTVFREIMMRAAPHFTQLNRVLNDIPGARISLWESMFNKRPSAETLALRAQRKRLNKALLLQTPLNEVDADIRAHVKEIRGYLNGLYDWYTGTMGMQLGRRKNYYPLMLDTLVVDKNRAKFERILRSHGFSTKAATRERSKLTRDEDGGLNNGMQGEDVSSDFLGPGFTSKKRRAKREKWTEALRDELVEEGFYQQDIATTLIAYTEMMTRRAVWERRFHDPNRDDPTLQQIREYDKYGLSINHPIAKLQLKLKKALERGDLTEWQYNRINQDILPGYAGQLGLRTNSHIRKLNAGVVIYQNLRILAFAIFSQFVDVGTMVARGDVASAQAGLRQMLDKRSREDAMEMLEAIGAMRQGLTEHILNDQALNTFMTGNAKRINDLFFRYNMMEGWTNNMRALGLISGREFMQRNARKAANGDAQAQRYLDELDITAGEIMAWDGHSTTDMRINAALNRYIDESMIRPDPTIRPVWMSDPGYAIFAHLKGFVYGFHETFLRRVGREVKVHQNLLPLLALGMLTLPFAAVGYELRRKVLGTSKHAPEGLDYVQELVERSGMFGAFQLVIDMEQADQYGKPFALGIGGPAVEQLFDFFDRDLASWTPKAIPVVASIPAARQWVRDEME